MGLSGAVSLIPGAGCSRDALYAVYVVPAIVLVLCCLGSFIGEVLPSVCLTESLKLHHLLYAVVQVLTEQN